MELLNTRISTDQIQGFGGSEASVDNHDQHSDQADMIQSTYVNVTGTYTIYAKQ